VSVVGCGTTLEVHHDVELAVTGATATEEVSIGHFVVVVYVIIWVRVTAETTTEELCENVV
jgi:hypothetical protein